MRRVLRLVEEDCPKAKRAMYSAVERNELALRDLRSELGECRKRLRQLALPEGTAERKQA